LPNVSNATQTHTFFISNADVDGPFNLDETMLSAQTAEPEWLRDGLLFTDVEIFNGTHIKYTLHQVGSVDKFTVNVSMTGSTVTEKAVDHLRSHVNVVLGLKDKVQSFYETYADPSEPLSSTFSRFRGLRLMRATNLFESLIFSILSQNNSVRLMNRTARLLMQHYGTRVAFPDGSSHHLFPTPEALAKCEARQLRSKTSMGYRAKSVVGVSRMVCRNEIRLDELAMCSYDEAFGVLLDLPGVGPKVADCFLLYGLGKREAAPVDVWIHRIVSKLYFKGKKITRLAAGRFLRERFRNWAGYAQLYLFDYARRGPVSSKAKAGRS